MAARLRPQHQDECRAKIQTTQLINRLQGHALGEIQIDPSRIRAIEILLRKTIPDLAAIQHEGGETPIGVQVVSATPITADEWASKFKPE